MMPESGASASTAVHNPRECYVADMRWGRLYFGLQALAGAAWWVGVATVPFVRVSTLGSIDPIPVAVLDVPLFVLASAVAALGVKAAAWVSTVWTCLVSAALAVYAVVTTEAGWGAVAMIAAAAGSVLALGLLLRGRLPTEWIILGPFAFRPASSVRTSGHLVATFLQIVVFWGFFLAVLPLAIRFAENRWGVGIDFPVAFVYLGIAALILASGLGIWSALTMAILGRGTPLPSAMTNELVIAGPYRFVRNPMALAGITQGVAVGLLLSSWLVVVYALLGSLVWNYAVRPHEEADLEQRFGDPYREYRSQVRCWLPRLRAAPQRVPARG